MLKGDPVLEQCLGELAYHRKASWKEPEKRARVRGLPVRRPSPATRLQTGTRKIAPPPGLIFGQEMRKTIHGPKAVPGFAG